MQAAISVYGICLIISAILTLIASIIAWRRSAPGSFSLSILLLSMTVWSGFYGLQWLPVPAAIKLALPNFIYIGVVGVPTLFLLFAMSFTGHDARSANPFLWALAIEPVVTLILLSTNQYHRLIFRSIAAIERDGLAWLEIVQGRWYTVNMVYSYAVILAGVLVIGYGMLRSSPLLRYQYRLLLLASLLPWGVSIHAELFMSPIQVDLTSLTFGLSGILFTYSVIRNRFMDIIPVARTHLIESMSDGILVLDTQNRIVDINPAMESLLGESRAPFLGKPASQALSIWTDETDLLIKGEQARTELSVPDTPSGYLDVCVTPLYDNQQRLNGRLMVFRDVTDQKRAERNLRHANERLQSHLLEIGLLQSKLQAQAVRDPLTDLFNRRYMNETLDRELARANREGYPVCIIMMDIDHFKKVNDTHGHEAGDLVLKALANALSARNRRGDFPCRFGGEEFVLVMPNIDIQAAYRRAEELRSFLNAIEVPYGSHSLSITISMGIACYPANGRDRESIVRASDRAMYAAKNAGRNHILTYDQLEAGHNMRNS